MCKTHLGSRINTDILNLFFLCKCLRSLPFLSSSSPTYLLPWFSVYRKIDIQKVLLNFFLSWSASNLSIFLLISLPNSRWRKLLSNCTESEASHSALAIHGISSRQMKPILVARQLDPSVHSSCEQILQDIVYTLPKTYIYLM